MLQRVQTHFEHLDFDHDRVRRVDMVQLFAADSRDPAWHADDRRVLRNLTQHDMAAAAGISNSIKQLAGSVGIAILTAVYSARTAFHAAHETVSASQTYVEGVTDALGVVTWLTLAAGLPLLWVFRKKRKKTPAGNPGAAGEAGES